MNHMSQCPPVSCKDTVPIPGPWPCAGKQCVLASVAGFYIVVPHRVCGFPSVYNTLCDLFCGALENPTEDVEATRPSFKHVSSHSILAYPDGRLPFSVKVFAHQDVSADTHTCLDRCVVHPRVCTHMDLRVLNPHRTGRVEEDLCDSFHV